MPHNLKGLHIPRHTEGTAAQMLLHMAHNAYNLGEDLRIAYFSMSGLHISRPMRGRSD